MQTWRLRWSLRQLSLSKFAQHRRALRNPWNFYGILILKLVPNLWRRPFVLKLRMGNEFQYTGS